MATCLVHVGSRLPHRARAAAQGVLLLTSLLLVHGPGTLAADPPDRSKPPELGAPPELRTPPLQRFKLSNDLPVVLMEKHDVPLIEVILLVQTGTTVDPEGKNGLASLTLAMLMEGAGPRDALQLADEIDFLGANLASEAGLHTSEVSLHTPVARLDPALQIMADVVQRPTFPAKELERLRKQRLTALAQAHDQPTAIAAIGLVQTLFGRNHPYGRMTRGTAESLMSFTVEDCRKFHAAEILPSRSTLIVVGDVTSSQLLPKLEAAFGRWSGGSAKDRPAWPVARQVEQLSLVLIDKPGAPQSVIQIGRLGAPRLTEDYYALTVLNTILGGSFTSRLNQNLREQHGYTYGARSSFDFRAQPGPFVASASVQTEVTDKALTEFMKELQGIMGDLPEEEVERAKKYVALSYSSGFQTVGQIASELSELVEYNLPDSFFNEYIKNILKVTKEQVEAAAKKWLDPTRVVIVVVGDRQKIEPGLQTLGLTTIQPSTVEQVLGPVPAVPGN